MKNQGGFMGVFILIFICLTGSIGCLIWLLMNKGEENTLSQENAKQIQKVFLKLEAFDKGLAVNGEADKFDTESFIKWREEFSGGVNNFQANLKQRVDEQADEVDNCRDHIERLQKNDQVFVQQFNSLNQKVNTLLTKPLKVEIAPMKTESHSTIVKRKGEKPFQKTIQYTKPVDLKEIDEAKKKYKMPGIKEAKDKIVEAGL